MRVLWHLAAAAALITVAVVSLAPPPADAGCPAEVGFGDLRVRKAGKQFVGAGVYYPDPQRLTRKIDVGETAVFEARVRNDFKRPKDVFVRGFPDGTVTLVKVVLNGRNITENAVDADGKRFRDVAAQASTPVVKFRIKLLEHIASGASRQHHIWGYNERREADCPAADDFIIDIKDRTPTP